MTETPQAPAPPAAPAEPPQPGFFERAAGHVFPHGHPAAAAVPGELKAAFRDHAGTVFDVAGDVLALLGTGGADQADAAVLAPKVLAMAEGAARLAGVLHNAP